MFGRAIKFSPILLLTLNIWSSMICCCLGQEAARCSVPKTSMEKMEMAPEQGQSADHHTSAGMSCHGSSNPGEGPTISGSCGCGTHQKANDVFLLPIVEEGSISAPLVLFSLAWAESILLPFQTSYQSSSNAFLVSARWAPSLSVLARFLI